MAVQSRFGCGFLWGIPVGANPTPLMFAALQDVSVDFSQDTKMLYGSQKFPIEVAGGKGKIDLKATVGRIDPALFNQIYWGMTQTTGVTLTSNGEAGVIPSTPFQIVVANGATFKTDLGVYDSNTGLFLTRVASAPTTGQYTVTVGTGTYLFAAADVGHALLIYYTYTAPTGGVTVTGTNLQLGGVNQFQCVLSNTYNGKQSTMTFPKCVSTKLNFPFKQDDFLLPAFDFSAFDDGLGNIFTFSSQT